MKNLIKLNYSHLFFLLFSKLVTRLFVGFFSALMYIVFSDMYGTIAGLAALLVGFIGYSTGASQIETTIYTTLVSFVAKKSNLDFKEIVEKKEKFSIQFGNIKPVTYDPSNNKWSEHNGVN